MRLSSWRRREILLALGAAGVVGAIGVAVLDSDGSLPEVSEGSPLSKQELALITAMAEGIIPATDTPGAAAAGVPDFIATMYRDWLRDEEQAAFREGLMSFQRIAQQKHGKNFADCTGPQQFALLSDWDKAAAAPTPAAARPAAKPPFFMFKALTIVGYYTSQIGQEQELGLSLDAGLNDPNGPYYYINELYI